MRRPWGTEALSPVLAVILLVAITVVLTTVLYLLVLDLASGAVHVAPHVVLGNRETITPTTTSLLVMGVSAELPTSEFRLQLFIDFKEDVRSTQDPLKPGTVGNLTYVDRDGDHIVSQGDAVFVATQAGHTYELILYWGRDLSDYVRWDA